MPAAVCANTGEISRVWDSDPHAFALVLVGGMRVGSKRAKITHKNRILNIMCFFQLNEKDNFIFFLKAFLTLASNFPPILETSELTKYFLPDLPLNFKLVL